MELDFKVLLAALSLLGGIIGATLKAWWDRRAEKKKPKTETRAQAYEEFVAFFLISTASPESRMDELARINARILVFGESKVVKAVTEFLKKLDLEHSVDCSTLRGLVPVIKEMRSSLLTGHKWIEPTIQELLNLQVNLSPKQPQQTS